MESAGVMWEKTSVTVYNGGGRQRKEYLSVWNKSIYGRESIFNMEENTGTANTTL